MKRYFPIIMLLIMSAILPTSIRAAAPDSDRDTDQLGDIGRELSHATLLRRNPVQGKHTRPSHHLVQKKTLAKMQQSDLLRELLASETVHHESTQMRDEVKRLHE